MSRIVLISGTDTGIGKTWVGCRLAEAARAAGVDVRALKLVETGTAIEPQPSEDGVLLALATRQRSPKAALRRYRTPIAAAAAADREGIPFDLPTAVAEIRGIAVNSELTLVEGAGGLLAPLTWAHSLIHAAQWLKSPVLLVAADSLGTINHTLLALHAMDSAGVRCLAVVINTMDLVENDASIGVNAPALRRLRPDVSIIETSNSDWTSEGVRLLMQ